MQRGHIVTTWKQEVRGEQEAREKTVTLYQGTIRELELDVGAEAQDYARFVSEEKNFQIADEDVRVALNDQALDVVHDPLWRYRNRNTASGSHQVNNVVQDFTLSDGSLELRFGTRNFGRRLTAGAKLNIAYVLTDGAVRIITTLMERACFCRNRYQVKHMIISAQP